MENIHIIWKILGVTTVVSLIVFWRKRNAVWGGFIAGAIIGLIATLFFALKDGGFNWFFIGKVAMVGTMIGLIAELLGKVGDFLKKK